MRCVFNSVDEDNYSRISVTIPPLSGCKYTAIRCDSFTCNCNIRVLKSGDYLSLTVGNKPITIYFDDWCNLNVETFCEILNGKLKDSGVICKIDNCGRYYFECNEKFCFNDMTYNVKLLIGLYSKSDAEIRSEKLRAELDENMNYRLKIKSVGTFLSTPVLNLVSNIGNMSLHNKTDDIVNIQSCNSIMTINNSFSPNMPIVASSDGSVSIVPSGFVSGAVFVLVDANSHQIDLLSPMYISLTLEPMSSYE